MRYLFHRSGREFSLPKGAENSPPPENRIVHEIINSSKESSMQNLENSINNNAKTPGYRGVQFDNSDH